MPRQELIVTRPKPSLWDRIRSYAIGPLPSRSPELARYFGGGSSSSGVHVNEYTALHSSPVWSAVMLIADDIASLPLHLYKRLPSGGKDRFDAHPLYELIHDYPNPEMDSMVWRRTMQIHALLWQNAYAEIERDGVGRPVAVWPLVPESVTPFRDRLDRDRLGPLQYRVTNPSGTQVVLPASDMLHLVGYSHSGSVGSSLVEQARDSIGLTLATERLGGAFFGNGMTVGGVVTFKGAKPSELGDKNFRESMEARHQGVDRAYRLLTLYNDAKYEKAGVDPNQGQFNETRVFQIREVARWFKMPPHKLGDLSDATFSNVEQQDAAYYSSCIRPWLTLWQQQLSRKLIAKAERFQQVIEHDTHGFLSVDATSRASLYTAEANIGSLTINEIRDYENRNPIAGGDVSLVQIQNIPVDMVAEYWRLNLDKTQAEIEHLKAPPPPAPPAVPPPPGPEAKALSDAVDELRASLTAERARVEQEATDKRQAIQRADDLSAALAQETDAKDAALADVTHVRELLAGAEQALGQEQSEHGLTRAKVLAAEESRAQATAEWDVTSSALEARLADTLAQSEAAMTRMAADLTAALDACATAQQAHKADMDAAAVTLGSVEDERDGIQARLAAETAAHGETVAALAALEAAREADLREATAHRDAIQAERDVARNEATDLAALTVQAQEALRAAEAEQSLAAQALEGAQREIAISEQTLRAANETLAALQGELAQTRQGHASRLSAMLSAHRSLAADIMGKLVEVETTRARKHSTTPDRLRSWIDNYYDGAEDIFASALLPVARIHVAFMGAGEPDTVAMDLAKQHIADSVVQLRNALNVDNCTEAVERIAKRWETTRHEQFADALLQAGVDHVRSLR